MDITLPVLIFATSLNEYNSLPKEVKIYFFLFCCINIYIYILVKLLIYLQILDIFSGEGRKYTISNPSENAIQSLYSVLIDKALTLPIISEQRILEELPIAPASSPPKLSESELKNIICQEENTLRELRIFLRDICAKLARNKQ